MEIIIVGSGKLTETLIQGLSKNISLNIIKWDDFNKLQITKVILIHAGSGRQLTNCIEYCNKTKSILIELSTGSILEKYDYSFPVIICPNTSLLILKTITGLKNISHLFSSFDIKITESHQKDKKTLPGTALELADIFKTAPESIVSVRDEEIQKKVFDIPEEYLNKHAYHKIQIGTEAESVEINLKILGHKPYMEGIAKLIDYLSINEIKCKKYHIIEFVENGFI